MSGWLRERGMGASILVATISSAFGVLLILATLFIGALLRSDPYIGDSGTLMVIIAMLSVLLVGLAMYVAAIVTANTFQTVVAGRTRQIALHRLIGATAQRERRRIGSQGAVVGAIGALLGLVLGVLLGWAGTRLGIGAMIDAGNLRDDFSFSVLEPVLLAPAAAVVLTTWAAAWSGSRAVLAVTPLQAVGAATPATHGSFVARRGRNVFAIILVVAGLALLAAGVALGLVNPVGVVVAFLGGLVSFTGLAMAATVIMPPLLNLSGALFGGSASARMAAQNAMRYPERSSRMSIGVVMGVTLVMMFAVALETVKAVSIASSGGEVDPMLATSMDLFTAVMMGVMAVSAVIAGIGLVNLLTIGVVQRKRELGLLRTVGMSNRQLRSMILFEAAHITLTSLIAGLALGTLYGWAGAQSLLGSTRFSLDGPEPPTLVLPAVPLLPTLIVIGATVVLTLVAALVPTRIATRVTPVQVLA